MSITTPTLPPLGAYPDANATDAQRDAWFRLAQLHMQSAQVQATAALAEANASAPSALAAFPDAIAPTVDRLIIRWEASDAAMDRLSAAIAGFNPNVVSGESGLTAGDVEIVGALAGVLRP